MKHGEFTRGRMSPEYAAFYNARSRCKNPVHPSYPDYGGRGIEFLFTSFQEFLTVLGRRPSAKHSLDRYPNNNGHYEPNNVRWATVENQQTNKRNTCWLIYNGVSKPLTVWCRELGIHKDTVKSRLRAGWTVANALGQKAKGKESSE